MKTESHISVQLTTLTEENKFLRENLQNRKKGMPVILQGDKGYDDEESLSSGLASANPGSADNSPAKVTEITSEISEASSRFREIKD